MITENGPPRTGRRRIKRASKQGRVLRHALTGARFTRFDAERTCRDHVLNTTISCLQRRFGLNFERELVEMQGPAGKFHCAMYWLAPASITRARELLGEA